MTKLNFFSGIDISKSTFDVSYEFNGKYKTKKFEYTIEGMAACVRFLPQEAHCIMESTGTYHCRLAYYLYKQNIPLSVVNPLSVRRFSQALMLRTKTDRADSKMLVDYGKYFNPTQWVPKADHYIELQQQIKYRDLLLKEENQMANQLEAITHSIVKNTLVVKKLKERLGAVREDIEEVEKSMEKMINEHESESFKLLTGIPGIGKKTAIALIADTGGMKDFNDARQISSYFGMSPRIYESGSSVKGIAKICKIGKANIRKLLYMCALTASRHNKACHELYERLLLKGKHKKLALIAVANKLLKQAFSILKNKNQYDANFYSKRLAS